LGILSLILSIVSSTFAISIFSLVDNAFAFCDRRSVFPIAFHSHTIEPAKYKKPSKVISLPFNASGKSDTGG
jgi:hypothetical protein